MRVLEGSRGDESTYEVPLEESSTVFWFTTDPSDAQPGMYTNFWHAISQFNKYIRDPESVRSCCFTTCPPRAGLIKTTYLKTAKNRRYRLYDGSFLGRRLNNLNKSNPYCFRKMIQDKSLELQQRFSKATAPPESDFGGSGAAADPSPLDERDETLGAAHLPDEDVEFPSWIFAHSGMDPHSRKDGGAKPDGPASSAYSSSRLRSNFDNSTRETSGEESLPPRARSKTV